MPPEGYTSLTVTEEVYEALSNIVAESDEIESRTGFVETAALSYIDENNIDVEYGHSCNCEYCKRRDLF